MAVVTLVLSFEGDEGFSRGMRSLADVEKVLRQVAASNADVLGAEILWTPED
jgi:hypothetical protein